MDGIPPRPVSLPDSAGGRLLAGLGRAARKHCPYCGGGAIFQGWLTLKDRCPNCGTLFAYEDGYFLGAYAINLIVTELATVALVIWLIAGTDLDVLPMQLIGISLAVGLPLFFYPIALLIWIALDNTFHPPGASSGRQRS
jgi:uncharacterized protein (DUF983 family)